MTSFKYAVTFVVVVCAGIPGTMTCMCRIILFFVYAHKLFHSCLRLPFGAIHSSLWSVVILILFE